MRPTGASGTGKKIIMSIARVYKTKTVRKDWTCEKCRKEIKKGVDGRISFAVGFRGREHTRCTDAACYPTRAELESSAVATVYDAVDSIDVSTIDNWDDFIAARDEVVSACEEVADEYENNEMFEINYDLQERAETIRSAGDDLGYWEPKDEAPVAEDFEETEDFEEALENWLEETRSAFQDALNDMDLP